MSGPAWDPIRRVAIYAAPLAVAGFLVIGAFSVGGFVHAVYLDPDHASTPVIAELFGSRGSGQVTLGNYPWLESLFADRWTRTFPGHRTIWEAWPFVLYFATAALVGWTVARTASRRAGLLVGLAMAVPAAPVIGDLAAPALRGTSFAHAVLLSALLVLLPRAARAGSVALLLWSAVLALTLAPGVASDPTLLLVWAVAPFLAAVAVGWRHRFLAARDAAAAAGSALLGTALGYLLKGLAEHDGIRYYHLQFELGSISKVATNARLWLENVATFVHGRFQTPLLSSHGIEYLVAALAVVGIPLLSVLIARMLPARLRATGGSGEARLLLTFWAASLAGMTVVFLAPIGGIVVDVGSLRYLTVLWPALLVLAAVSWGGRAVPWLAVLVVVTAALGCLELLRGDYGIQGRPWLTDADVDGVTGFVEANGLSHGYAPYRDAAPLTYASDFEVRSYPVNMCGSQDPTPERCQFSLHTMDSWYRPPAPGARTFYIWDDRPLTGDLYLAPPPRRWGRPFRTAQVGHLHLYAYDNDLGRWMRLPPARFAGSAVPG